MTPIGPAAATGPAGPADPGFDAVVVAGGSGRRLGGVAKPELVVGGRTLLETALAAVADARRVVVVGPRPSGIALEDRVLWTREQPPGGGPVAALAAGLALVREPLVVVLAADLPFVTAAAVSALVDAAPAVAVDDGGRDQPLLAAYATTALRAAVPEHAEGVALRVVLQRLQGLSRVALTGSPPPWWDCDTPAELDRAREWHDA